MEGKNTHLDAYLIPTGKISLCFYLKKREPDPIHNCGNPADNDRREAPHGPCLFISNRLQTPNPLASETSRALPLCLHPTRLLNQVLKIVWISIQIGGHQAGNTETPEHRKHCSYCLSE